MPCQNGLAPSATHPIPPPPCHRRQEHFPASEAIIRPLCEAAGMTLHKLDMSELAKADGALTCCSVLGSSP